MENGRHEHISHLGTHRFITIEATLLVRPAGFVGRGGLGREMTTASTGTPTIIYDERLE